jgi:hypothetical protein
MRSTLATLLVVFAVPAARAPAAELRLLPDEIQLTGPSATQRLRVVLVEQGRCVADVTDGAELLSSDPAVARVRGDCRLEAVGDGEAVLTAAHAESRATARVRVARSHDDEPPGFRNTVVPLLTKLGCNSGSCHGAASGKGGLHLSLRGEDPEADYLTLTRDAEARRINRQDPRGSLLLLKPTLAVPHAGGLRFATDSPRYRVLRDWVAAGVPGPAAGDARVERVEVLPNRATLKSGDVLQVVVRAWHSDGTAKDVTDLAKFESSEEAVASVGPAGEVRVGEHGEAVITVWYSGAVAACRVVSPLPQEVDPERYCAAPRHNYIDHLILAKLQEMRIPPSPPCEDHEFIRRAYLDATGTLPTPAEVRQFLADPSPDKRSRLIDHLLERPEFVDYWTYKWSDLLLVSSRKLPQPVVWSYYQYIRQSVASNKPWDRFAREILTARGDDTLHQGAGTYFLLHQGITDLTETTATTFMGLSITCCRCHNHPTDRWTQAQYWGLANLFSRVAVVNGDQRLDLTQPMGTYASGSNAVIKSLPAGEVLHPRTGVAVPPSPLGDAPMPPDSPIDRRVYFADWLTSPTNPYFARALVNRVWKNFFGRGLVEPEDDLRDTNPPTNEELLDALCKDFVAHCFDIKHLMRTILNSAAYQRSSTPLPANARDDRFGSHYLVRPLAGEVLLDAFSEVTAVPTAFTEVRTGVSGDVLPTKAYPVGTRALQLPDTQIISPFLSAFGRPSRSEACSCERKPDPSLAQALHLINGGSLNDKLRAKDCRIEQWLREGVGDREAVSRLFLLALSRPPTPAEEKRLLGLMAETGAGVGGRRQALEDLFWGILTRPEFLLNH